MSESEVYHHAWWPCHSPQPPDKVQNASQTVTVDVERAVIVRAVGQVSVSHVHGIRFAAVVLQHKKHPSQGSIRSKRYEATLDVVFLEEVLKK